MEATPAAAEPHARIARLERHSRMLSAVTAILALALLLSAIVPNSSVSSRRFVLLDGEGHQWGMWRVQDEQPAIVLQDSAGLWRALMRIDANAAELGLSSSSGEPGVTLAATETGASVTLHDPEGRPRVLLTASDGEGGRLTLLDGAGNVIATLPSQ
jgi:hypothetical protein